MPANHAAPRLTISGTSASVSTLLIVVGMFHSPFWAGKGGLMRGYARLPSTELSRLVSSPQM